jgi:hypothetical protein
MKYLIPLFLIFIIVSCDNSQKKELSKENTKLLSEEKSWSKDLYITVTTRFDSKVDIKYIVQSSSQFNSSNLEDSLSQHINEIIVDSLRQYDMYEMWSSKRGTIEVVMGGIITSRYPEIELTHISEIIIPKEAETKFLETENSRRDIIEELKGIVESRKLLIQKLETNSDLSQFEIVEIEKEIKTLDNDFASVQKKGKLITLNFKL